MIERILINGSIYTQSITMPRATALAISQGRIVAVGSDDDILALATSGTVKQNLEGKAVIPGLTDAHIHWQWTARALQEVDVFEVPNKHVAVQRVADRATTTTPGQWITGHGWAQAYWPDLAFPSVADLDAVTPANPVYLRAKSGHAAWVNSRALEIAGITADTPDPEGGQIGRDEHGQPNGLLFETAMGLVSSRIPSPTLDQIADQMAQSQKVALASGLTGFHDFDGPECMRALQVLRERGDLHLRVLKNVNKEWIHHALELGVRRGFGDDWIRIGALKIFADGALGPLTALMIEPYEGQPQNFGIAVTEEDEMRELVSKASAAGLPSTIHAIGDCAVRRVLDVYEHVRKEEAARGEAPSTHRHRIEHVQVIHPQDKHRLAELNLIASMQPLHATSDYEMADRYWGARCDLAYNARLQIDQGVVVAFGSDSPIDPFPPLGGIYAAVTRRRPDGTPGEDGWYPELRLTMAEALYGFTIGPAYAAGMDDRLGRLAPGYLADLVVLDRDLFAISPDEILDVEVVATMVGGEWRFGGL
jgi:predicted amidohydrolase YtcJ